MHQICSIDPMLPAFASFLSQLGQDEGSAWVGQGLSVCHPTDGKNLFGRDAKPLWFAENNVAQDCRNVSVSLTDVPKIVRERFEKIPE